MLKTVGLLLLLLTAQHGAVVHELSHVAGDGLELRTGIDKSAEAACALCPAFAQVVSPAFSHSLPVPKFLQLAVERVPDPPSLAIAAAVPNARSRGPPVVG
jgi:hypothetical protein